MYVNNYLSWIVWVKVSHMRSYSFASFRAAILNDNLHEDTQIEPLKIDVWRAFPQTNIDEIHWQFCQFRTIFSIVCCCLEEFMSIPSPPKTYNSKTQKFFPWKHSVFFWYLQSYYHFKSGHIFLQHLSVPNAISPFHTYFFSKQRRRWHHFYLNKHLSFLQIISGWHLPQKSLSKKKHDFKIYPNIPVNKYQEDDKNYQTSGIIISSIIRIYCWLLWGQDLDHLTHFPAPCFFLCIFFLVTPKPPPTQQKNNSKLAKQRHCLTKTHGYQPTTTDQRQ